MEYKYASISELDNSHVGEQIILDGRIHNIRNKKNIGFIVLRNGIYSIQCVVIKNILGMDKFKELCDVPCESYIALYGKINRLPENVSRIQSCSYQDFEFSVDSFKVISKSSKKLPFQLDDANNVESCDTDRNAVLLSTKLDNRSFDLRAPINKCIFKLQSGICELFREYLLKEKFMEIHTPKLINVASEGGAQVFGVKYFNKSAYLAQSPQLYKQMCINSDFNRVFEIGSVFRAENANSHRHLTEFIGLDVEMTIPYGETYNFIIKLLWRMMYHIYANLKINYRDEYNYIKNIHKFEELVFPQEPLIIDFKEGVRLLNEYGFHQDILEDLSTENERQLGKIIKDVHNSDLFLLDKYPTAVRPFYTMASDSDPNYTNSYDLIMRGEEICSGAQRIHDYEILKDNIQKKNINESSLQDYVESFSNGSKPHGGFGLGLERVLMLILNLGNVRRCSLYPRDPVRLTP